MSQGKSVDLESSKVVQVGVVVKNLEDTMNRLSPLGIGPFISPPPPEGAEGLMVEGKPVKIPQVSVTQLGDIELELIQAEEGDNPWWNFLDQKGDGIQHIALKVDNIEEVEASWRAKGAKTLVTGKANGNLEAAYVDLGVGNIIIELLQK